MTALLVTGSLLALPGCGSAGTASKAPSPPPSQTATPGPVPGPECDKIWIEGKDLPNLGFGYTGCYRVENGRWTHEAHYTECYDDDPDDMTAPDELWEYTNPETGVLLYTFLDGQSAVVENGSAIAPMTGEPVIATARSVCINGG